MIKRYNIAAAAAFALTIPSIATADFIGFTVGAGVFKPSFSGDFKSKQTGSDPIDLEKDLGLGDDNGKFFYAAFEHPIPLIPNIRLARTEISQEGSSTINRDVTFEGTTYSAASEVSSSVDLSHIDATIYYEILDNWVNVDLGLTVRKFDGEISLTGRETSTGATQSKTQALDFPMPLLYGKVRLDLPFTGLYAEGEGNWIGYDGNNFFDVAAKLGYESSLGLGVEGGIRTIKLEIDYEDEIKADLDFSGVFVNAFYHF